VLDRQEIELWPKEMQGMRASGAALRKTLDVVLKRVG
jgi:L-lactate dehydrogenase